MGFSGSFAGVLACVTWIERHEKNSWQCAFLVACADERLSRFGEIRTFLLAPTVIITIESADSYSFAL